MRRRGPFRNVHTKLARSRRRTVLLGTRQEEKQKKKDEHVKVTAKT
jgi:hypothetical protein